MTKRSLAGPDVVERSHPHDCEVASDEVLVAQQILGGLADSVRVLREKWGALINCRGRRGPTIQLGGSHEQDPCGRRVRGCCFEEVHQHADVVLKGAQGVAKRLVHRRCRGKMVDAIRPGIVHHRVDRGGFRQLG